MTAFPGSVVYLEPKVNNVDPVDADHINALQDEVIAVESYIGASSGLDSFTSSTGTTVTKGVNTYLNAINAWITALNTGITTLNTGVATLNTGKANLASPTFTGNVTLPSTTSIGSVSNTEIGYLDGVSGGIQGQLNAKASLSGAYFTGGVSATDYAVNTPLGSPPAHGDAAIFRWTNAFIDTLTFRGPGGAILLWGSGTLAGQNVNWNLGLDTLPWRTTYSQIGTIVTSDARLKGDISPLSSAELAAGAAMGDLLCGYVRTDNIDDGVRHAGVVAQEIAEAMAEHGLDVKDYGCLHQNDPDNDSETFWAVSYDELLTFICASQQKRINDLEARLTALEGS